MKLQGMPFGSAFFLVLFAIVRSSDGQCILSLEFPLDQSLRTVPITKTTTSVTIAAVLDCTGDLPTSDIATTITYTGSDSVVTSPNPVMVTIFSGSTSRETTIDIMDTSGGPDVTFMASVSTSATDVSVDMGLRHLTFSIEDLAEISFDDSKTYQGQLGDTITVCLLRTGTQGEITVDVDALMTTSFLNTPVQATFAANSDTATVDIMVTGDSLQDTAIPLVFNSLPTGTIVTRDANNRAVVTVLQPVTLSTATTTNRLSAISSFAVFTATASRSYPTDITIDIAYSGDFTILDDSRPSTITLRSGTTSASVNIMIVPTSSHTFAITMTSASNGAMISSTQFFTTYTIDALDVLITANPTSVTASEGTVIMVSFTIDDPAPAPIEIDLFTPDASHAQQLSVLPNAIIPAGETRTTVRIEILQDSVSEGTQTVMVAFNSLTNGASFRSGSDSITITITDSTANGPIITFPPNNPGNDNNNNEGLSGGAIAGIVIGSASFLILVLGVAICCGIFAMSNGCGGSPYYNTRYPATYRSEYPIYPTSPVIYEVEY